MLRSKVNVVESWRQLTRTDVASGSRVSFRARSAKNDAVRFLQTDASPWTRAFLTVVWGAFQRVAIVTRSAAFAIVADGVMFADASARLDVAGVRVSVAGARDAFGQRTLVRCLAPEARGATLAKLTDVSVGTSALGKTIKRFFVCLPFCRNFQLYNVKLT